MKNISPTVMPAVNRHCVILKQGDDLRQDMLTLRLLELFERVRFVKLVKCHTVFQLKSYTTTVLYNYSFLFSSFICTFN